VSLITEVPLPRPGDGLTFPFCEFGLYSCDFSNYPI
jgi:hypothetical protein